MKNSYYKDISKKVSSDSSLKKELKDAEKAVAIAQQLYNLRKNKGLTQTQFAKLIGVSQPNIARLESGDYKSYSLRTLNKAADALDSNVEVRITPKETKTYKQVWDIPSVKISLEKTVKKRILKTCLKILKYLVF